MNPTRQMVKEIKNRIFEEFLKEYEALCKKYGLFVSACGCCDSPWVVVADSEKEIDEHIEHLREQWDH